MAAPLPEQLRYLEPVLRELSKVPPEELNEDTDFSVLETALRHRVQGLSIAEAQQRIADDRSALQKWVRSSPEKNASGAWVLGALSQNLGPMVRHLLLPPKAELPQAALGPTVVFEPPNGWSTEPGPISSSITLRKDGQEVGMIGCIKHCGFTSRQLEKSECWKKSQVRFGECHGNKYLNVQTSPVASKVIRYVLEVPGGAVEAVCGSDPGDAYFDESVFEAKLHTLRIAEPS